MVYFLQSCLNPAVVVCHSEVATGDAPLASFNRTNDL